MEVVRTIVGAFADVWQGIARSQRALYGLAFFRMGKSRLCLHF